MRSRYTAFVVGDEDYLFRTWHPRTRPEGPYCHPGTRWTGLTIHETVDGGADDEAGIVEFTATYRTGDGRGAVVDENALVEALTSGKIAGAALDVYEDADKPNAALSRLDNVVMTPHVGTQTYDARFMMARELTNNVLGFVDGDRPVAYVVRPV